LPDIATVLAKLICAVMYGPGLDLDEVIENLEDAFGLIESKSRTFDFKHTDYYAAEMGPDLKKFLISFEKLFPAEDLWLAKQTARDIEQVFSVNGKRRVNLDPGYVESSKLVLASTKNFSHRIYLRNGIWAEVTLIYADRQFVKLPWTYPDYLEPQVLQFLTGVREALKNTDQSSR